MLSTFFNILHTSCLRSDHCQIFYFTLHTTLVYAAAFKQKCLDPFSSLHKPLFSPQVVVFYIINMAWSWSSFVISPNPLASRVSGQSQAISYETSLFSQLMVGAMLKVFFGAPFFFNGLQGAYFMRYHA